MKNNFARQLLKNDFTMKNTIKKTPVLEPLFNKVPGPQDSNLTKKRLHHRYFPVEFAKF